jgi:hypothetical protein
MQVIGFVAVSRPGDVQRMIRWEESWVPIEDGLNNEYEARRLNPTIWEWTYLDVSNPKRIEYAGPEFRWTPTAISEGQFSQPPWPREAPTETEDMRRGRIMVIRAACHLDHEKACVEPQWVGKTSSVREGSHLDFLELRAAA